LRIVDCGMQNMKEQNKRILDFRICEYSAICIPQSAILNKWEETR